MAGWNENSLGRAFVKLPVPDQILNTWNLLLYYSVLPKFFLNMDSAIVKYIYIFNIIYNIYNHHLGLWLRGNGSWKSVCDTSMAVYVDIHS